MTIKRANFGVAMGIEAVPSAQEASSCFVCMRESFELKLGNIYKKNKNIPSFIFKPLFLNPKQILSSHFLSVLLAFSKKKSINFEISRPPRSREFVIVREKSDFGLRPFKSEMLPNTFLVLFLGLIRS